MQQAEDFRQESRALATVLEPLSDTDFDQPTLFKGWTIDDVIGHLHMFNMAASKSVESDAAFAAFLPPLPQVWLRGKPCATRNFPGWMVCAVAPCLKDGGRALSKRPMPMPMSTPSNG